jgi:hypothetical protein
LKIQIELINNYCLTFKTEKMKKVLFVFALVAMLGSMANKAYAQLDDQEYNYVTMDLRGILNLTMTTNPQVDFIFKTIQEYKQGITKFNAVNLEVDATLGWDLFVFAQTDNWVQVEAYSTNGNPGLPAEILQIQSSVDNSGLGNANGVGGALGVGMDNNFVGLRGPTNSGAAVGAPAATTQFLAGGMDGAGKGFFLPGTANNNPSTHKFRIDMKMVPGIPAAFVGTPLVGGTTIVDDAAFAAMSTAAASGTAGNGQLYAQAGYYYLEVVYSLVEDL